MGYAYVPFIKLARSHLDFAYHIRVPCSAAQSEHYQSTSSIRRKKKVNHLRRRAVPGTYLYKKRVVRCCASRAKKIRTCPCTGGYGKYNFGQFPQFLALFQTCAVNFVGRSGGSALSNLRNKKQTPHTTTTHLSSF
jgi:hypothetical protein